MFQGPHPKSALFSTINLHKVQKREEYRDSVPREGIHLLRNTPGNKAPRQDSKPWVPVRGDYGIKEASWDHISSQDSTQQDPSLP